MLRSPTTRASRVSGDFFADALPAADVIDDARRQNAFGLLMSLNMLIELGADGGFDYTGAQYDRRCREAGFSRTEVVPLTGPASAAIARK